jgi:hypothetical protein
MNSAANKVALPELPHRIYRCLIQDPIHIVSDMLRMHGKPAVDGLLRQIDVNGFQLPSSMPVATQSSRILPEMDTRIWRLRRPRRHSDNRYAAFACPTIRPRLPNTSRAPRSLVATSISRTIASLWSGRSRT